MLRQYYFQELTCVPDADVNVGYIMGRVMNAVHVALVNAQAGSPYGSIGLSFPGYHTLEDRSRSNLETQGPPIGNKIRLLTNQLEQLEALEIDKALDRFLDYVHLRQPIALKRPNLKFAIFARIQPRGNVDRQIRRLMKRKGLSQEQSEDRLQGFKAIKCKLPYFDMFSHHSSQRFRLFIRKQASEETDCWQFSSYGLSANSAVPDF